MKKLTFGKPEKIVPSNFCKTFHHTPTPVKYPCENIRFYETDGGCRMELPLAPDEAVYGFGLQLKGFNHKGRNLQLRVNADPMAYTGDSHAPVPFFVTTKGYGIYIDTARSIQVCCGYLKKQNRIKNGKKEIMTSTEMIYNKNNIMDISVMTIDIPVAKGIDIYLFEGDTITEIVSQYNMLAGGGCDVPEWGLGILYRCYAKYTGEEVVNAAAYFREKDIPCDIIGLEPGWQSRSYSCSYVWNKELYPDHKNTVKKLLDMGFHINLWEHAFVNPESPVYDGLYDDSCDYEVWGGLVPDFAIDRAAELFSDYHKRTFVDFGIDGFKLDECDNSDFTGDWSFPKCAAFPSGMDGEQYHNMFGVLYMQAILKALGGRPTLSEVRNAGALSAGYPFVLYSDLYDHKDFIRGICNAGFSGLLWTPEVRDAKNKKDFLRRLQSNVFSVQCIINAWYCEKMPWLELDCENETRTLLKIRKRLIPMLKKSFQNYKETGIPPVRALVMDYTTDRETYGIDDEYIFCDDLIVAPMTAEQERRMVYLPDGEWVDYWSRNAVKPGWFEVKTENIPVFEKVSN